MAAPRVVTSRDELRQAVSAARREGGRIGVVPTMGALHEGHLSLVEACRAECDFVVVTVFVNPTQFCPGEDFADYPRDLEADLAALAPYEVDLVFAPGNEEMYRRGHETYVEVGEIGRTLEGASRPIHFRGVATIVLKLFNLVQPDVAYFGQKDYQQTLVVKKLVEDFDLPVEIRVCPTLREPDGLAMSSRNARLSADERRQALALCEGLQLAADMVAGGERRATVLEQKIRAHIETAGSIEVDYVALVRPGTVTPVTEIDGAVVVAVAAKVGATRLIDNRLIP